MLAVEIGGSSTQAVWLDAPDRGVVVSLDEYRDQPWLLAAPALVEGDRVRGAHHLGWMDIRASRELGMATPPSLSMNDADAAALGEWVLRGQPEGALLYISMRTGVGATAIVQGEIVPVEFGHLASFGTECCGGCGRAGCLDAQIGGHALPTPLGEDDIERVLATLQAALARQSILVDRIVIGGGLPRCYPRLVSGLQNRADHPVEPTGCPECFKSAAPAGLIHAWQVENS